MKQIIAFLTLLVTTGASTHADALNKHAIAAEAKWLIHVDADNLRQTQLGDFLLNHFVAPKAAGPATATQLPKDRASKRSPSTVRRQLAQAERDLALATGQRDELAARLGATNAHWELSDLAEQLAAAEAKLAAMEDAWLALAGEAEDLGLTN